VSRGIKNFTLLFLKTDHQSQPLKLKVGFVTAVAAPPVTTNGLAGSVIRSVGEHSAVGTEPIFEADPVNPNPAGDGEEAGVAYIEPAAPITGLLAGRAKVKHSQFVPLGQLGDVISGQLVPVGDTIVVTVAPDGIVPVNAGTIA
jgi:hypothetical protein